MKCSIQTFNADYILGRIINIAASPEVLIIVNKEAKISPEVYQQEGAFIFFHIFDNSLFADDFSEIEIIVSADGKAKKTKKFLPTPVKIENKFNVSPFAPEITDVLQALRPDFYQNWNDDIINQAVKDIIDIAYNGSSDIAKPFHHYLNFLKTMKTRFEAIYEHFPKINLKSKNPNAIDSFGVLTTPLEMLCIASYLYNLKQQGVKGNFAEFGCFKGFSSSCLSYACFELGINMDIFDSFCGLPDSSSKIYQKGLFAADFEEVYDNIKTFGRIDNITFHKGYFAKTVKDYQTPLMSFFMDVDLAVSAHDVLKVLPYLDGKSGFFSHESDKTHFINEKVVCLPNENEVINEIILAFNDSKRQLSGNYICGNTGFFKNDRKSFPIVPLDGINNLINQ